jgi:hypothetical protein
MYAQPSRGIRDMDELFNGVIDSMELVIGRAEATALELKGLLEFIVTLYKLEEEEQFFLELIAKLDEMLVV